jgi:glucosyl-dolichyl phosphate glucuronosyltransferase
MIDIPRLSVIIPTVNRSEYIKECLDSILDQSLPLGAYEIIVVDSSSNDQTRYLIEEFKNIFKNIIYYYEPKPGLHEGRNSGARLAKSEYLVYCDDDIIADYNWLEEILNCYINFENCGACGGKVVGKWEKEPEEWILDFGKSIDNIPSLSILDNGDGSFKLTDLKLYGCNLSMRKSLVLRMNGTPPDAYPSQLRYLNGDGEAGALRMIKKFGFDIIYNSRACVFHRVPKERTTKEYFKKRYEDEAYRSVYSIYRVNNGNKLYFFYFLSINSFKNFLLILLKLLHSRDKIFHFSLRYNYERIKWHQVIRLFKDKQLQSHILSENYMD